VEWMNEPLFSNDHTDIVSNSGDCNSLNYCGILVCWSRDSDAGGCGIQFCVTRSCIINM